MDIPTQLQTSLRPTTTPLPSLPWLTTLLTNTRGTPPPPLASLLATARARLLASDLTTAGLLDPTYAATHSFPANLAAGDGSVREVKLEREVVVQVVDVEDVGRGRWEVVEALEAEARGEGRRGREVVRLPTSASGDAGEDQGEGAQVQSGGTQDEGSRNSTHKLVVQDCKGQTVHAIELKRVERIAVGRTVIGEKILLKAGTVVARGVVLLEPAQCVLLGGKVEAWHRAWVDGRLARLREAVGAREQGGRGA